MATELLPDKQAFSQMGLQASYGQPIMKENWFIFQMLPQKLFIWADPREQFGMATFKILI